MQASDVTERATITLLDPEHVRWPEPELRLYLTDALMALASVKPEAFAVTEALELVAGASQRLPEKAESLLSVESLDESGGLHAVEYCDASTLDRFNPGWRGEQEKAKPVNYTHDARIPNEFYVYPPAISGTKVRVRYVPTPARVVSSDQDLGLTDRYLPALTDYVLYRSFLKDSESSVSAERAMNHLELFNSAVGGQLKGMQQRKPRANQPPNRGIS